MNQFKAMVTKTQARNPSQSRNRTPLLCRHLSDLKTDVALARVIREPRPRGGETQPTSARKIEANRSNSLKSTGPRTAGGKRMVARNALKHGIFSKNLLINDPQGGEHARDYWQLHAAISAHYQPVGLLEQLWVEKTAVWMWRLSRVVRCETGQIDRALANERSDLRKVRA